ncbi:alpha/beta fold hydrolase [Phreatobacter oligotrophus]|jgi:lysophospholipase|uniref:alpha/beta fold hydrolase n=1 Tax=Phreatobacter oligotrophus TaxID=1122261 RepID=UPI002353CB9D|nr:alpha/beta hydrolase [Phreatobacter oligotrophus]MBX9991722.1 alpha/beta hydrolase [Phreatobacter oligotrophus]
MDLVALPDWPIPPGVRAGTITTEDRIPIRYARWEATGAPRRGTVVICQGRAEFIEKYIEVIPELRERGFGVLAFDWRGQGGSGRLLSDGRKGHARRFAHYQRDLEAVMTLIGLPDCRPPYFALGHSMGGAILIEAAKAGRTWFDRMVLTAPMVKLRQVSHPKALGLLLGALSLAGLGGMVIPGGSAKPMALKPFEGNPVTQDPERYARTAAYALADVRLGLGAPTIGWLREALAVTQRFAHPLYTRDIRQPMLLMGAALDPLVDTPAVEDFARRAKAVGCVVVPGAKHELLQERDAIRSQFWAAFDAFIPGEQAYL